MQLISTFELKKQGQLSKPYENQLLILQNEFYDYNLLRLRETSMEIR